METVLVEGGRLLSEGGYAANRGLLLRDGVIQDTCAAGARADKYIDASGLTILPGFIDIHIHGALMCDFSAPSDAAVDTISAYLARHGVTGMVGTTMTMPLENILRCLEYAARNRGRPLPGAALLGLHLEGPFLSDVNRGAHSGAHILPCLPEHYRPILEFSDVVTTVTVSPGSEGAAEMIRRFAARGVLISGGHDDSCEEEILQAIEAGMSHTTHIFCAMSSLNRKYGRKSLGLTEMALNDDRLSVELIADGAHTSGAMLRLAYKCKGAEGMCLVSDMLQVGGLPVNGETIRIEVPGVEGGLSVVVAGGVARLADSELNAGSITPLDAMLKNAVSCGIPLPQAARMVSETPANIIGLGRRKGRLRAGYDADLCLIDEDLTVQGTLVGGRPVYKIATLSCVDNR